MKKKHIVSGLWVLAYIGTATLLYFINPLFLLFFIIAHRIFAEFYRNKRIKTEENYRQILSNMKDTTKSILFMVNNYARFTDDKGRYIKGRPYMLEGFIGDFWSLVNEAEKTINRK